MSKPNDASTEHPVAALLPWYLTGTLKDADRRDVDEHLVGCADCRRELAELTALRAPLKQAFGDAPSPVLSVKQSVLAQVHAEAQTGPDAPAASASGFGDAIEQWFRNLFTPRWVPALAAALLIGQLTLLLWTAGQQTVIPPSEITTRNIPPAAVRVTLAFQESTPEARIRAVIQGLQGRIVDGPTADGRYTIEIAASAAGTLDAQLQALRQQSGVIRQAERLAR